MERIKERQKAMREIMFFFLIVKVPFGVSEINFKSQVFGRLPMGMRGACSSMDLATALGHRLSYLHQGGLTAVEFGPRGRGRKKGQGSVRRTW